MKRVCMFLFALCLSLGAQAQSPPQQTRGSVQSPDKRLQINFFQKVLPNGTRELYYNVSYKGQTIIRDSVLELELDNHLSESAMALNIDRHAKWFDNLAITSIQHMASDTSWKPGTGEREDIRDHFNAMRVELVKDDNPAYRIAIDMRAYNEGVALRYFFPENEKGSYYRIKQEHTEFALPPGTKAWFHGWAQAPYKLLPLRDWPDESERPLTLELPSGVYLSLLEARMVDYARTKFKLSKTRADTIVTSMHDPADLISPFATPWRAIMVADSAIALAENSHFILNLNPPSRIKDESWIKPGKIIRVMTQTTADAKENIDFAAKRGLQYVLFDWKWYGPAFSFDSDATKVAIPNFDLPEIIRYGKEKGIGVWLYVNQQALLTQSDTLFQTYRDWGVKGVKFGFVQVGSHRWTTWIEKAIEQAAAAQIMVNIHDDWRPTGEQRTWPNLVTSEGIRGNEEMPDATHNTILPFTRFLAGAADYTVCYYSPRIKTTHAHQLALAAIYFSPLQTLYWYDKPAMSNNEPELEFWDKIPASWDQTKIIQGSPGHYVTTARRKGKDWFIGTITNNDRRDLKIPLSFLENGKQYTARIYEDDPLAPTSTKVGIRTIRVDSRSVIESRLQASSGQAIWLTPAN